MWHKRHRERDPLAPPGKRLRENLADLYSSGEVAGDRAQSLMDDAGEFADSLGSHEFQDLRSSGGGKNADRDLRRKLLRRSRWPSVYYAQVRTWSPRLKTEVVQKIALLLPHEIVFVVSEVGSVGVLCQTAGLDSTNLQKHQKIAETLGEHFISISLWGDGVPFSWDRKHSADLWTMSFPGLSQKEHRDIHICLTSLPHESVLRSTQDDVMAILAWSFRVLASGRMPTARHDGEAWGLEDSWRKRHEGKELLMGALIEIKGDWKQMSHCFAVPSWTRAMDKPICWRCGSNKLSLREHSGVGSPWLQNCFSDHVGLEFLLSEGGQLSPIFSAPFMTLSSLRLDWLHVADQGVTAVYLGGLFDLVLNNRAYGPNKEARLAQLWAELQAYYHRAQTADRLNTLTLTMIKPKKGSIELSASGAEVRAIVPFAEEMVNMWPEPLSAEALAARAGMRHLSRCYFF